ncbi:MAG: dicarboxylate/amino acid:cation symporter [Kofleriaceae bacterium]|nr:MAG: dicarboxylate/amino acid:cation symporter [Kofleriaceae bacterium]MBZ0233164.1 dicarboxylate/amino acid:cation symporter [Kofleriaceae bacterium]
MGVLRAYGFSLLLLASIVAGLVVGRVSPSTADALRPIGDLFLNLIFMIIVPLVFFTVASSIATAPSAKRLSGIAWRMFAVFLFTSVVAAVSALVFMLLVRPSPGAGIEIAAPPDAKAPDLLTQLVKTFTASDFPELISRNAMLPLIVFSIAVGVATLRSGERGAPFARLLESGAAVFTRLVDYVMYVAPVGLFAWFGAMVVDTGDKLATAYLGVFAVYYAFGSAYFVVAFSAYAYAAGRVRGLARFWKHMLRPSLTAVGTCSSMATMPINLEAAPKMGVPAPVADVVVPIGAALHKDGSVIGGVLKILFAMSLFGYELTPGRLVMVVAVAILVGVVMGAIPSGGMIGELLILSVFGFPAGVLPLLAVISVIIDPLATLLNATGDNAAAMMVTRMNDGDVWAEGDAAAG